MAGELVPLGRKLEKELAQREAGVARGIVAAAQHDRLRTARTRANVRDTIALVGDVLEGIEYLDLNAAGVVARRPHLESYVANILEVAVFGLGVAVRQHVDSYSTRFGS